MARSWPSAVSRTWRQLPHERRLAAGAAIAMFATLFLPWYQDTVIAGSGATTRSLQSFSTSITGWGAFSFVEAAVLLVAAGVLALLFIRADGGAFHIPGGDGVVVSAAGLWACVLILWRIFDKEGAHTTHPQYVSSTGIEWGIFIALGVAGFLAYAGSRMKRANEPEPPLPGEAPRSRRRERAAGAEEEDASWSEAAASWRPVPATDSAPARRGETRAEPPTRHLESTDEPPTRHLESWDEPPTRRVEFPPLDQTDFEDPPTARLGRSASPGRRPPPDPEQS